MTSWLRFSVCFLTLLSAQRLAGESLVTEQEWRVNAGRIFKAYLKAGTNKEAFSLELTYITSALYLGYAEAKAKGLERDPEGRYWLAKVLLTIYFNTKLNQQYTMDNHLTAGEELRQQAALTYKELQKYGIPPEVFAEDLGAFRRSLIVNVRSGAFLTARRGHVDDRPMTSRRS